MKAVYGPVPWPDPGSPSRSTAFHFENESLLKTRIAQGFATSPLLVSPSELLCLV